MRTFGSAVKEATAALQAVTESPALDAVVLISAASHMTKEKLLASYPDAIPEDCLDRINDYIDKRRAGVPVAYITESKEFYGREFHVDSRVLIPRPDTEILVEAVIDAGPFDRILDIGTGSGCIAITLAAEISGAHVTAVDSSPYAIQVCEKNANTLLSRSMEIVESDLFEHIHAKYDCIVSNPPYLTDTEWEETYGPNWSEPSSALKAGDTGLDILRRLIGSCVDYIEPNGYLFLEASPWQVDEIRAMCAAAGLSQFRIHHDLAGDARVFEARENGSFASTAREETHTI